MSAVDLIRWFASLAITLGLFGLGVWALRRHGPNLFKRLQTIRSDRRLTVVESLHLDPQRRLVLVSLDGREQLILLGEGRLLGEAKPSRSKPAEAVR
jgi:flagellar protein FliO/FliZ